MSEGFDQPAPPGEGIKWDQYMGSLLIIDVLAQEHGVSTTYGMADPLRANVSVIDGNNAGEENDDVLIFPKVLNGQLKNSVGKRVLGRLGQGKAKPGQSAPWMLEEASTDDTAKAEEWLKANKPATSSPTPPF